MSKNKNSHVNEEQHNRIKGNLRVNGQSLDESSSLSVYPKDKSKMKLQMLVLFIWTINIWSADPAPAVAKSRQFIPPLPGYIPVYIRPGNTPLEEINLDLAEAFKSYALKRGRLNDVRSLTLSNNILTADEVKDENDISNVGLESDKKSDKHAVILHQHQSQHIQKITKLPKT